MHKIKSFLFFLKTINQQRYVIKKLVARDFQKKYLGSYLGLPWAFLQPAAYVLTIWFVFSVGLRVGAIEEGIPFLPWLLCGMVPWLFMSESINSTTGSLLEYTFLIKQLNFRVGIIPLIKIVNALIIHFFLLLIMILIVLLHGFKPTIYWIQLPYYLFASLIFLIGLGWLSSAMIVFVRDTRQIVNVMLTLIFWLTPIIWSHTMLQGRARLLADLNPLFYITNGYRDTFINGKWFFEQSTLTIFYWAISLLFFVGGAHIFQKLKPHFADVL